MTPPRTILVVEDEPILRTAYALVLESKGYKVTTAENGKAALEALQRRIPDLILLDLLMPVMDGKAFLLASDVLNKYPQVKVMVSSNLSDQSTVDELLAMGVHAHILKSSMSPSELTARIEATLMEGPQ